MSVAYKLNRNIENAPSECGALDVAFLNRNTFGDNTLRKEIIGLFLSQLDGVHRTLSAPVNQAAWQFLTHTLKGAAAAVGATAISRTADRWGKISAPVSAEERRSVQKHLGSLTSDFRQAISQL